MHTGVEVTRLIHENMLVVVEHAFAQPKIRDLLDATFEGEWKYLRSTLYEVAEVRADRALLEMAAQMRILDDKENIGDIFRRYGAEPLGTVEQTDGTKTDLHYRDMTNKILHAKGFEWDWSDRDNPGVICHSLDESRWVTAEIKFIPLMGLIGDLMY
ncbi:hypothetical protein AAFN47_17710 [Hoeflea sp. CAU 1731]